MATAHDGGVVARAESTVDESSEQPGLRERKKQATRDALRLAALRLATERDWAQVRVEDIAAAAGVSTRTFNNYFATKDEAYLANAYERAARFRAALAERPADEPLWSALTAVSEESFAGERFDRRAMRSLRPTASLAAEQLKAFAVVEQALAQEIAARIGTDAERDIYPRLVAAAVVSATRVAFEHWIRGPANGPFVPVLRDALARISAGLPQPKNLPQPKKGRQR